MEVFQKLICFESQSDPPFKTYYTPPNHMISKVAGIIDVLREEKNKDPFNAAIQYVSHSGETLTINTQKMSCTCYVFSDKSMCHHLIASCMIDDKTIPGVKIKVNMLF